MAELVRATTSAPAAPSKQAQIASGSSQTLAIEDTTNHVTNEETTGFVKEVRDEITKLVVEAKDVSKQNRQLTIRVEELFEEVKEDMKKQERSFADGIEVLIKEVKDCKETVGSGMKASAEALEAVQMSVESTKRDLADSPALSSTSPFSNNMSSSSLSMHHGPPSENVQHVAEDVVSSAESESTKKNEEAQGAWKEPVSLSGMHDESKTLDEAPLPAELRTVLRTLSHMHVSPVQIGVLDPSFTKAFHTMAIQDPSSIDGTLASQMLILKHALDRRAVNGSLVGGGCPCPRIIVITVSRSRAETMSNDLRDIIASATGRMNRVEHSLAIGGRSRNTRSGASREKRPNYLCSASSDILICTLGMLKTGLERAQVLLDDVTLMVYIDADKLFPMHTDTHNGHILREIVPGFERQAKKSEARGTPIASLLLTPAIPSLTLYGIQERYLHDFGPLKIITTPEFEDQSADDKPNNDMPDHETPMEDMASEHSLHKHLAEGNVAQVKVGAVETLEEMETSQEDAGEAKTL